MSQLLFRKSIDILDEFEVAKKYFNVIEYRSDIEDGNLVIPRYSALPFYNDLEYDVKRLSGTLIQSYAEHKYVANFEYYEDIKDLTFETWRFGDTAIPDVPLVVKGVTNSKKWNWNTLMYATDKATAIKIACELGSDGLIGYQDIILRRFQKLKKLETGINGLPFSEEYRFFFLGEGVIADGFYWSIAEDIDKPTPEGAREMAKKVAKRVAEKTSFFVVDVAQLETGDWICVELNCGTMSGLSTIDPDVFYARLSFLISQF